MEAKVENGQDTTPADRKRPGAIALSAPEAQARTTAEGRGSAGRTPPQEAEESVAAAASRAVLIPPLGESAIFGTSLRGYTLFHMVSLGDGDAEVNLTWLSERTPEVARMFTNRRGGSEIYRDQFHGARVAITNLSETSSVQIRVTLCP